MTAPSLDAQEWERMRDELGPVMQAKEITVLLPPHVIAYLRVYDSQGNIGRAIQLLIHEHIMDELRAERENREADA